MANEMFQADIDELLKETEEYTEENQLKELAEGTGEKFKHGKIYAAPQKRDLRFHFPYISPLIKSNNFLYNPPSAIPIPEGKVVVRSLNSYLDSYKKS